jgi:hypothetical protein
MVSQIQMTEESSQFHVTTPFIYPWFGINFFLIIWVSAKIIYWALRTQLGETSELFMTLDIPKRRNVITYVMEILLTTFALIAQLYSGQHILFQASDQVEPHHMEWMVMSLQTLAVLYVWELIYREYFGWPLLVQ